ncbi:MAG: UPF0042 nucleotide-binding protein [Cellvibrionaceae bacterium]|jgi:UPF0042 nucleotide-binding protein
MRLIIISGRSGSGKSTALHVLEDMGFTCIDNLPASLLPALVENIERHSHRKYAVSIDARNTEKDLAILPSLMATPAIALLSQRIFFLDADEDCLIQRFGETRRRHPLSNNQTDLRSAIIKEHELLRPIMDVANAYIDTTDMAFHDLRDLVKRQIASMEKGTISLLFLSFGFKYGLPKNADIVFDIRCLPNPHWNKSLRQLTGNDQAVIDFLARQDPVNDMYNDIRAYLERWLPAYEANNRSYLTVAVGCTGGQHRSVYLCNELEAHFNRALADVQCQHRELQNNS